MNCSDIKPLVSRNCCDFILPQIKQVFEVLPSVKIKGKQYARPFYLKSKGHDFYVKNISENRYLNGTIQHIKYIK